MPSPTATTTAVAFEAALLAALQADTNLTGATPPWQITDVYPGNTLTSYAIYFGKITAADSLPVLASTARIKRQEEYVLEVHIDVSAGMADTVTAKQAALGALGEIDNILATFPSGPTGILTVTNAGGSNTTGAWKAFVSGWELRPYMDDTRQGWAVLLSAKISVSARLG
jgi:hypothetical protein